MLFPRPTGRLMALGRIRLLGLLLILAGPAIAGGPEVEFPGPITRPTFGAPLCAAAVPWSDGMTDYLLVGDDIGYANLYYHFGGNSLYQLLTRLSLDGGAIVSLDTWRTGPAGERTLVAATTNPDRLIFLRVETQSPFIVILQSLDLPEDPGRLVFLEPRADGGDRLAVSLPGWDSLALLEEEEGVWSLLDTMPAGDQPLALAALDWDDDGRLDLLSADRGPLSGNLSVYSLDEQGTYALVDHWTLAEGVREVLAGDFDLDGQDEFLVSYAGDSRMEVYSAVSGSPVLQQSIELAFVPDRLHRYDLFNGHPAIVSSNEALGLVEFLEFLDGQWVVREILYTGGQPLAVVPADLNGDGYQELNCLDTSSNAFYILLGNNGPGYWGYPARPLPSNPLNLVAGDFDGDGQEDIVLSGIEPVQLVFYPQETGLGPLDSQRTHDLEFFPGVLCAADFLGDGADELGVVDLFRGGLALLDMSGPGDPIETAFLDLVQVPGRMSTGDVDGDGHQDLIAVLTTNSLLHLYFGDGSGGFSEPVVVDLPLGLFQARPLHMNGDNLMELVATDTQTRVWVVPNLTGRTFGAPVAVQAGSGARYLDLADLDGDLDQDVLVGNVSGESISLLENVGDGTLVRRVGGLSLQDEPRELIARDMNEDGLADILVTVGEGDAQQVFLATTPWEYDPVASLETTPSVYRSHVADFNGDQRPDILNVDSDLRLGVVLRNTALVFVGVENPLLEARCLGGEWEVWIQPAEQQGWVLYATDGHQRRLLARPGQAALGRLDHLDGDWRLRLEPGRWFADPSRLVLELVSGDQVIRLDAPTDCGGGRLPRLQWQTQPWPNPFNPRVEARIRLEDASFTRVTVHDLAGRRVATLLEENLPAGSHPVAWDGRSNGRAAAAGVYFLRVGTEQGEISRKIVLIK